MGKTCKKCGAKVVQEQVYMYDMDAYDDYECGTHWYPTHANDELRQEFVQSWACKEIARLKAELKKLKG
jgi:hypothetical protein